MEPKGESRKLVGSRYRSLDTLPYSFTEGDRVEHVATVRVIFGDTDAGGIVYYANYLRWFEVGRAELMRRKGFSYLVTMERGVLLPVIEVAARYHASARYDDVLGIHAEIRDVRGVRLTFGYRIERDDGASLVTGHTVHAFTGRDGKPVRPPAEFRALSLSNDNTREKGG
jgi:acyl-CoA thioester hydrolase